jgi:transcriptional regulator with XRE-family HTH domain
MNLDTTRPMGSKPMARGEVERALGERFRAVRRRQKCWLADLSKALDCSINTIRWHEAGARMMRADMIVRAAAFMGVEPDELVSGLAVPALINQGETQNGN